MKGCFPGSSASEEFACSAGDLGLIPGSGRSLGEVIFVSSINFSEMECNCFSYDYSTICPTSSTVDRNLGGFQFLAMLSTADHPVVSLGAQHMHFWNCKITGCSCVKFRRQQLPNSCSKWL